MTTLCLMMNEAEWNRFRGGWSTKYSKKNVVELGMVLIGYLLKSRSCCWNATLMSVSDLCVRLHGAEAPGNLAGDVYRRRFSWWTAVPWRLPSSYGLLFYRPHLTRLVTFQSITSDVHNFQCIIVVVVVHAVDNDDKVVIAFFLFMDASVFIWLFQILSFCVCVCVF